MKSSQADPPQLRLPWDGRRPLGSLKEFLRRPAVIVAEILIISAACMLGASLPQVGRSPAAEVARLWGHGAFMTNLARGLALDHVFTSRWFLSVLLLAAASLAIVIAEQMRRLRRTWRLPLTEAHFLNAPLRREFRRVRTGANAPSIQIHSRGRLGLAGSPLFHTGLLCVILGGGLSALFGVQAVADVYEGELVPATTEAWAGQWPGPLGQPFRLDEPLRLVSLESTQYPTGQLMALRVKVASGSPGGAPIHELGINEELRVSRGRLYLGAEHGPTALLEWRAPTTPEVRTAVLLEKKEVHAFGAYAQGPGSHLARIRVPQVPEGQRPDHAEVRVRSGALTLAEGILRPGETMVLPDGGELKLHGLPFWARLHGSRDPAIGVAYLGFALVFLGTAFTFGLVRVDEFVSITPEGDLERVVVALRPFRFEALFQERFERLVREHGGEV